MRKLKGADHLTQDSKLELLSLNTEICSPCHTAALKRMAGRSYQPNTAHYQVVLVPWILFTDGEGVTLTSKEDPTAEAWQDAFAFDRNQLIE